MSEQEKSLPIKKLKTAASGKSRMGAAPADANSSKI
jgi:hypothetical protein